MAHERRDRARIANITIQTFNGFSIPMEPGKLEIPADYDVKEHLFTIENVSDNEIRTIPAIIQFAEPPVRAWLKHAPVGVLTDFRRKDAGMMVSGSPGASVTISRPIVTRQIIFEADRVPARQKIEISFLTSQGPERRYMHMEDSILFRDVGDHALKYYIEGSFQFIYQGASITRSFFAAMEYDAATRHIKLEEVAEDRLGRVVWEGMSIM